MENKTLGTKIAVLRKKHGMTQLQLAEKMGVTDKAVSKWERDRACPDLHTLPKLAQVLDVSVEELLPGEKSLTQKEKPEIAGMKCLVLRAVALAMGITLVVLSYLGQLDGNTGFGLTGVGLTAMSMHMFLEQKDRKFREE